MQIAKMQYNILIRQKNVQVQYILFLAKNTLILFSTESLHLLLLALIDSSSIDWKPTKCMTE